MIVIKPPHDFIEISRGMVRVFLAGTIDMGTAIDWQADVERKLSNVEGLCILNPLRARFDASMVQSIDNPDFTEQVIWELDALDAADIILLNFVANSKSPISLMELGLYAKTRKVIVCCPEGFWRKGNVDIVCDRFGIPVVGSIDAAITLVSARISYLRS